ncbi:hypothetical protein Q9Q99_04720 [Curtobacterium flaccumfaciens]|nr:hypothetical protein Q9Q99_04720 [Curtobacterium flaccumfaciens]
MPIDSTPPRAAAAIGTIARIGYTHAPSMPTQKSALRPVSIQRL